MQDFDVIRFKFDDFKQKINSYRHSRNLNPNEHNNYSCSWAEREQFLQLSLDIYNFIKSDNILFEEFNRIKDSYKNLLFSQEYNRIINNLHTIINNAWYSFTDKEKQQEDFLKQYKDVLRSSQIDENYSYILKKSGMPDLKMLTDQDCYLKPKETVYPRMLLQRIINQYEYMCLPTNIPKKVYYDELESLYLILETMINSHIEDFNILSTFADIYKKNLLKPSYYLYDMLNAETIDISSSYMVDCVCNVLDDLQIFYLSSKYKEEKIKNDYKKISIECNLTPREEDVFRLMSNNISEQKIADTLNISINTVRTHRKNIHKKLYTKDKRELILKFTPKG